MDPFEPIKAKLEEWKEKAKHELLVNTLRGVARVNLSALVIEDPDKTISYKIALDALKGD